MDRPGFQWGVACIPLLLFLFSIHSGVMGTVLGAEISGISSSQGEKDSLHVSQETPGNRGYITMNFRDVDIQVLITFISELTGKNFLLDPAVRGRVTILSPQKVTVDEAYRVFLSVLEVHGFTAVQAGSVTKIIRSVDAKSKRVETFAEKPFKFSEDKIVTQLVPLKNGAAADFAKFLSPLIPKTGLLIPYPETNTLIIIDMASNVERLTGIIRELDIPAARERIQIFPLAYANAERLSSKLGSLFQMRRGPKGAQGVAKIIAEERTNSLIVLSEPDQMEEIEKMLDALDRKLTKSHGSIHIYHLENAVAEEVAGVLGELPGKGQEKKEGKAAPGPAPISRDVHISADKATNTLVIIAEPDEYKVLEQIIQELDVPRPLVYVEALILEVSANKALDLGVEWRVGDEYKGGLQPGGKGGAWTIGSQSPSSVIKNFAKGSLPAGFTAGVVGRAITLGNITFPSISAFVRAVRTDSDFNVISTPQILTLDNEEAVIEVGQNIPYVTSVVEPGAITDRPIQNFEYRDIGVTLRVTPHLNTNETIKLEVEQSIKNVVDTTAGAGLLAPTTTYRTTKSTITVGAGETAVIGGLVETQMSRVKTQTPCLGGFPGLGWAFKQVSDEDDKRNLLVFLTPHIIGTPEQGKALYGEKRGFIDKEMDEAIQRNQPEEIRRKAFK